MQIISWNVNGIRAALRKGFSGYLKQTKADIYCIQETKAPADKVELDFPDYHEFWNHADKKGYSGTLIVSKNKPINVIYDMGVAKHDNEGRIVTAEYDKFYLVNVYVPNSKRGLKRLPYREKEWDVDFLKYLKKIDKKKPVIICGDFNVAHTELDLANPKNNKRTHGFTEEERNGFTNLVNAGFIDTFREFEKGGGHYTWWSQMTNCRERNIGWRIDYFLISSRLRKNLKSSKILSDVMGSDHCPIRLELKGI